MSLWPSSCSVPPRLGVLASSPRVPALARPTADARAATPTARGRRLARSRLDGLRRLAGRFGERSLAGSAVMRAPLESFRVRAYGILASWLHACQAQGSKWLTPPLPAVRTSGRARVSGFGRRDRLGGERVGARVQVRRERLERAAGVAVLERVDDRL